MNDLIFASTSPRRKELLLQISKRFKFRSPDFQEKKIYDMSSLEISKFNSENKAMSISKILRNDFIFGADTVININNETIYAIISHMMYSYKHEGYIQYIKYKTI